MEVLRKIKLIAVWILAVAVVIALMLLLILPWVMLKQKNKKIVLTPKVKIVDVSSKDEDQLNQFAEAVIIDKRIISKLE